MIDYLNIKSKMTKTKDIFIIIHWAQEDSSTQKDFYKTLTLYLL